MIGAFARRVGQAVVTLAIAFVVIFVAVRVLPNNPVLARYGQHATPERVASTMAENGWDRPIPAQLARFGWGLVTRFDLGRSFTSREPVTAVLARTIPATVELTIAAMAIAFPLGVGAGVVAAVYRDRWPDWLMMTGALVGVSIPIFFLGICLIAAFPSLPTGMRLPTDLYDAEFDLPSGFYVLESILRGRFDLTAAALRHLVLPAVTLATIPTAIIARITRAAVADVLASDYIRTARAKGASRWRVLVRHALPNAAVPIANITGFQVGALLSGAVLTETVFAWPGLGSEMVRAVLMSDYAVVQAGGLVIATMFVTLNLLLDLLFRRLDPRLRT